MDNVELGRAKTFQGVHNGPQCGLQNKTSLDLNRSLATYWLDEL